MRADLYRFSRFISFLLGLVLFAAVAANAQQLPRSVTIASNPPGHTCPLALQIEDRQE